jgi:hypothetical protein
MSTGETHIDAETYGSKPLKPVYVSVDLPIPDDFLSVTSPPPDALPMTIRPIDFSQSVLPERAGCYAVVLDNVLSPSECQQLLRMAEASVPESELAIRRRPKADRQTQKSSPSQAGGGDDRPSRAEEKDPWRPALISDGGGWEVRQADYRNGDRIIWDQQEIANRIWARLSQAPGLRLVLAQISPNSRALPAPKSSRIPNARWKFLRLNRRMRFLKYEPGGFFKRMIS